MHTYVHTIGSIHSHPAILIERSCNAYTDIYTPHSGLLLQDMLDSLQIPRSRTDRPRMSHIRFDSTACCVCLKGTDSTAWPLSRTSKENKKRVSFSKKGRWWREEERERESEHSLCKREVVEERERARPSRTHRQHGPPPHTPHTHQQREQQT